MHSFSSQDRKLFQKLEESLRFLEAPRRVLLALSGGPDSMALFQVLTKQRLGLDWAVAHVDHGWRKESAEEAIQLEALCRAHSIPFYLKTLDVESCTGNQEEHCRQERLRFFREICTQQGYQAVLMAHQMNDQAETVLKRVFEGASLIRTEGMRSPAILNGLMVIRPWLDISKQEIIDFLARENISYFEDHTNRDPQYLRAKMRESVIPELTQLFGKNIMPALVQLGKEAEECRDYLEKKVSSKHQPLIEGPIGTWLLDRGVHPFEFRYLLKSWKCTENLSRAAIDDLINHYVAEEGSAVFPVESGQIVVDKGRLFFLKTPLQPQNWKIEPANDKSPLIGWESVFQGCAAFMVPEGQIRIGPVDQVLDKKGKEYYLKRLSSASVPHFLRQSVPVAMDCEGEIYSPFFPKKEKCSLKRSISLLYA
jgi:tRNA(Ile)-lysidine synthase